MYQNRTVKTGIDGFVSLCENGTEIYSTHSDTIEQMAQNENVDLDSLGLEALEEFRVWCLTMRYEVEIDAA